jgi:hypothetical protein
MPRISDREHTLLQIKKIVQMLMLDGKEDSDEFKYFMDMWVDIDCHRCINSRQPVEKNKSMRQMLWRYNERQFRQLARMEKRSFIRLVEKLERLPGTKFHSTNNNPMARHKQAPIWLQSLVALNVLGCEGNGASQFRNARAHGIGDGTVNTYTSRFIHAIILLKKEYLYWPKAEERRRIAERFASKYGLYDCVFIVDGTYVNFAQKPGIDGETYFHRKSKYGYNIMLLVDDNRRILYYLIGWPGSVSDSVIWQSSNIFNNPGRYLTLAEGEFGIADAGYGLHFTLCTPYKQPAASIPQNSIFNDLFSIGRNPIECANADVKNRFCSLRAIRTQIREHKDFELVNDHILACLILHNICIAYDDDQFEGVDEEEDDDNRQLDLIREESNDGVSLRERVQVNLLRWGYTNNFI